MKQTPSNHLFVINAAPADQEAARRRLASLGEVRPLEGSRDLLLLSVPPGILSAESAWSRARELLGSTGTVQPVLIDELGEHHFPTGEISVRFHQSLAEKELSRFAKDHGLRLRSRNQFIPQQAIFHPVDVSRSYIPELVEKIAEDKDIKAVWANTLTRFQRASSR
jgi:hypothetical protein